MHAKMRACLLYHMYPCMHALATVRKGFPWGKFRVAWPSPSQKSWERRVKRSWQAWVSWMWFNVLRCIKSGYTVLHCIKNPLPLPWYVTDRCIGALDIRGGGEGGGGGIGGGFYSRRRRRRRRRNCHNRLNCNNCCKVRTMRHCAEPNKVLQFHW